MPYDMTQMRAHLQGYMQRINDSMTSDADVQRYGGFVEKLRNLADQTERHYRERIPFTAEERAALRTCYTEAIDAVSALLTEEETGPVGLRLRLIGRELAQLEQPAPAPREAQNPDLQPQRQEAQPQPHVPS